MIFNYFIIIIVLLIGFMFLLSFLNLKIEVRFIREDENDEINLSVSTLNGLLKYKVVIPFMDLFNGNNDLIKTRIHSRGELGDYNSLGENVGEERLNLNELKLLIEKGQIIYKNYHHIISYIMEKIVVNKVDWQTQVGLDDAANTAILTGTLWGIKSSIMLFFKNKFHLNNVYLNVAPYYISKKFAMTFNCIVTLKIGYIINVGIKLLLRKIRGGDKFERSSN